jgi:anti-sigma factor ChrR (cupin superfamily)
MIKIRQVQEFEDFPDDIKEAAQGFCEMQSKAWQSVKPAPKQEDDNDDLPQWHFGDANNMEWQVLETGQMLKFIATAKGTGLILSKVPPGCKGPVHVHEGLEYLYVIEGSVVSNGKRLAAGCGFIAEPGTLHEEFTSSTGATFVVVATFPKDSN